MLLVVSPAKTLDYESSLPTEEFSQPDFLERSEELIEGLRELAPDNIASLMGISEKLSLLNFERFQNWSTPFGVENARPAVFAFKGDVYQGLDAYELSTAEISFAQERLRILSGLYGILRPLDLIQPYRLEMGTRYGGEKHKNLYSYWNSQISEALNKDLAATDSDTLVNLASQEYFRAVDIEALGARVVTPVFKEKRKGGYKIISFSAKRARGRMSAYILRHRISEAEAIQGFDWDGYQFMPEMSGDSEWIFARDEPA